MINMLLAGDIPIVLMKAFNALKTTMMGRINLTAIASAFAAVFVIIKLIGIINKIESDDQAGGFGHVPLFDIIRPLVFYFLTVASPTIVTYVDGISVGLAQNIQEAIPRTNFKKDVINFDFAKETIKGSAKDILDAPQDESKSLWSRVVSLRREVKDFTKNLSFTIFFGLIQIVFKLIYFIVYYAYQFVLAIMVGVGELKLVVFAILMPFSFAVSILEPWKTSYQKVIGYYVEICFWAPTGLIIMYAVNISSSVITTEMSQIDFSLLNVFGDDSVKTFLANSTSLIGSILMMALAIQCMQQIPDIANKALSLGSSADSYHGGAETVPGDARRLGNMAKGGIGNLLKTQ